MRQVARAANTAVTTRGQSPQRRKSLLEHAAKIIARTQQRNFKAKQSHRRRTIRRLAQHGIEIDTCRCCLPENKT
jgi:hypothetical protein